MRFRALFDEHHLPLLAYALRRTPCAADAADVMADTMLVAWRRLEEVPAGEGVRPWLYGVARKVLGNRRRTDVRQRLLSERLAAELGDAVVHPTDVVPDQMWIREALSALDDIDREVLTLTAWEGLSSREISLSLGIPATTVRTRLHRARARLRAQLEVTSYERSAVSGHELIDGHLPVRDAEEVR